MIASPTSAQGVNETLRLLDAVAKSNTQALLASGGAEGALQHFQQAIALDSSYVSAYYGLAGTYELLDDWVVAPKDSVPKALAAVQKGLELDPSFAEAHTLLGTIHFWYDFDQAAAEKEFLRGIELNTNFDDGHDFYGWFLGAHKRIDQSIAEHRRAMELSPLDLQHHLALSQSLYYNHRYDEAYEELRTTLLQNPNAWWGHEILGWVYEQKGDLPRAVAEEKKAVELEPKIAEPLASLGRMYALSGDRAAALKIAGQLEEWKRRAYVSPYPPAILYEGLGDQRRALAEYQSAYEARSWLVDFAATDPKLDRIRGDKKFQDIQRAVGVP